MASAGLGGRADPDHPDCRHSRDGSRCSQPRSAQRSELAMGVPIRVRGLNAWFGSTQALYDIAIDVSPNHATAIIGPSGCGKSTFVRCLNRMHETIPNTRAEGQVKVGGMDIYDAPAVDVRRKVGMVFQKPNPFPSMSIYDNVAAGLKLNGTSNRKTLDEAVERSLRQAAL